MKTKKIIAVVMTASMLMSLAACSFGNKTKKFVNYAEDLGYEEVESKEYTKLDKKDGDLEDGCYSVATNKDDIKKLLKKVDADVKADDLTALFFASQEEENEEKDEFNSFGFFVMEFKNEDDAEEFFEDYSDEFDEQFDRLESYSSYGDMEQDDDDNFYMFAVDVDIYGSNMSMRTAIYLDGKEVICVISKGYYSDADDYTDLLDDFCKEFDLESPSDLL